MGKKSRARRAQNASAHPPASAAPPEAPPSAPVTRRAAAWAAALVVGLAALALYVRTTAPTATLIDSGELILAAHGPGVAHPPGTPVWVMLAHAATRLPLGSVARRVNLSSAFFAALAAAAMVAAMRAAWLGRAAAPSPAAGVTDLAPLLLPALLLASGRTLWNYATVAEVYALNTLLLVALLALVLDARRTAGMGAPLAATLVAALGLGVHHVTVALTLPGLLLFLFLTRRDLFTPRRVAALAAAGLAALALVYAWLPWAASHPTGLNWGDPSSLARFVDHVTGRQYRVFIAPSWTEAGAEAAAFVRLARREFGAFVGTLVLALTAWGAWTLARRDRPLALALGAVVACDFAYGLLYVVAEDKDAYYLPARVALALAAGAGAVALLRRAGPRARPAVAGALLLVPMAAAALNFRAADRSRDHVADDYVRDVMAGVAPHGLLLTGDWQVYSPALYFREIERRRADATLVDVSLLRRSWYFDALKRRSPELLERVRPQAEAFLEDLRGWERDPRPYDRDLALNRRITERFHALVLELMAARLRDGRAYATSDAVLGGADRPLAEALQRAYAIVPVGLVFELLPKDALGTAAEERARRDGAFELRPRGLFDGTRVFDPDDVVTLKVRPVYLTMLANRGRYLAARGDRDGAAAAYRQVLAWDPNDPRARSGLAELGPR